MLDLEIQTFWTLVNTVGRIRAENELRLLQVYAAAGSSEGMKEMSDALRVEIGRPIVEVPKRDADWKEKIRDALQT